MLKQEKKKLSVFPILGFFALIVVGFLIILTYNDLLSYKAMLSNHIDEEHQVIEERHELYVRLLNEVTSGYDHSNNSHIKNKIEAIKAYQEYDEAYFNKLQALENVMDDLRAEKFNDLNDEALIYEFQKNDEKYEKFITSYNEKVEKYNRSLEGALPRFISKITGYNEMPHIN
ncbi:hypothetical protein PRVXH_001621 [Proteinivorax hydrogeniformans]|uniref:LemA family protein n=1 Tax=Proteinivorax hydrogeniformans TaxID=1826727 RepID=A0AAU8HQB8_9FIRM